MDKGREYLEIEINRLETELAKVREMLGTELDADARMEIAKLEEEKQGLVKALDGGDQVTEELTFKAVIMEARPGVGGDEAKIWAEDLLRMYSRYAAAKSWRVEELDEGVIKITSKEAYEKLKYETGVHRVQRVPETEASGRIHTSTASIVVLPEVPEAVVDIREDDLVWEFVRGGGHGGQNVNKVATSVRLTHVPSGLVVKSSQERFQEQNRKIALSMLRAQLWEIKEESKRAVEQESRSAIGRSMRAEKIRTYNYPQNRVTDHRIGKSWYQLDRIIAGVLDDVLADVSAGMIEFLARP